MAKGRTVLIMEDPEKGATAEKYRPITCLPVMWKLLAGIIAEDFYEFLNTENVLPDEQKGCRKNSQGTKDQLYTDKMVLNEVKSRKKNIAMAWIDYKKAYDIMPHSWILKTVKLSGAAENIRSPSGKLNEELANGTDIKWPELRNCPHQKRFLPRRFPVLDPFCGYNDPSYSHSQKV